MKYIKTNNNFYIISNSVEHNNFINEFLKNEAIENYGYANINLFNQIETYESYKDIMYQLDIIVFYYNMAHIYDKFDVFISLNEFNSNSIAITLSEQQIDDKKNTMYVLRMIPLENVSDEIDKNINYKNKTNYFDLYNISE